MLRAAPAARTSRTLLARARDCPRAARVLVVTAFVAACLIGITWGLPGGDSWAADSVSPRSTALGAIALTYWPGHFHHYPPLHTLLVTVLALPWIAATALRVGTAPDVLAAALIEPRVMTGVELASRALTLAMASGIVWSTMRLWARIAGERAAVGAGVIVATNATLVYYAHTGNLEVPYLFWTSWALVEIDRVAAGEPREVQALLLATAAALTKDQAAAAFVLVVPAYVLLLPSLRGRGGLRRSARAAGLALAAYMLVSGALVNPTGFARRWTVLLGPASETWSRYPRGLMGALAIALDAARAVPRFTSWPIATLGLVGAFLVLRDPPPGVTRARAVLPLVASASFTLFFTLAARRTEDRFLLPQSLFFLPYASIAFARAPQRLRPAALLVAAIALAPAVAGVAQVDATLLGDARYEAERYLAALPAGTRVEALGGSPFLPRIPRSLVVTRSGAEPVAERRRVAGVVERLDPAMDLGATAGQPPEVIVLATELSSAAAAEDHGPPPFGVTSYRDEATRRLLAGLASGALGYDRVLRARCAAPSFLPCRRIHESTGGECWIYRRRATRSLP